jgi:hypothetical protein
MKYERLKENLQILDAHNHGHGKVISLTGGQKTETVLIDEIVSDYRKILDKIEQGTLIELPCKVGDTVYVIHQDWDEDCKDFYYIDDDKFSFYLFDWWGVTVFLTREEAEKRLKELQNG